MTAAVARQAAPLPAVQGYVEAIAEDRIHGWAWSPAVPGARLRIELREDEVVLQSVVADRARADLARNGVGDGAHAFVLDLDPRQSARSAGFDVIAIAPDGTEVPLAAPPPSPAGAPDDLRRLLEGLAGSQRVLHRNLQSLLLAGKAREPMDAALERIATAQKALDARTAELELFVTRLDDRLASLAPGSVREQGRGSRVALGLSLGLVAVGTLGVLLQLLG